MGQTGMPVGSVPGVPPPTGGEAPLSSLPRAARPGAWLHHATFAGVCFLVSPWLGLTSFDVDPRIAEIWPSGGVGFVLLTTVWARGRRTVAATCVAMLVVVAVTSLALGNTWATAGWWGLLGAGQPLLMAAAYRRLLGREGWSPESPLDLARLMGATLASSLVVGLLGGFPSLPPEDAFSRVLVWWVLRNTVFCFVGGATFLVLFHRARSTALPVSPPWSRAWLALTSVLCVYGTYHDPTLPLSWLLIVPSVWGGLTLTVRGAAQLGLGLALLAAVMTFVPANRFGYVGWLPAASVIDLLVTASTAFTLMLALFREQRARLIEDVATQARLLAAVFESMRDGVMVVEGGVVTMHNTAARQLLGRPIPHGRPPSWVEAFGATRPDGAPVTDEDLCPVVAAGGGPAGPGSFEVTVGHDGGDRTLEVSTQPLDRAADGNLVMLLHDATAERARIHELSNFAGTVAHDLRGPLTVLDGWLEFVQDGRLERDEAAVDDALRRSREASRRMREVIEDWLGYTVIRNGQLHPSRVDLAGVGDAVAVMHRSDAAEADRADIEVDLPHAVIADPGMLRQVLDNLVGNAVKYTPDGATPYVALRSRPDGEPGWVRIDVTDHGMGVPEGQEELIFEEFARGPGDGRTVGTGLGLALSRRIVELHGGHLSARRNEGTPGSTFTFTLPEG